MIPIISAAFQGDRMKKWTRRMVLAGLAGAAMAGGGCAFYNSTRVGKLPEGDDLVRLAA